jgi:hypothetical protein
VRAAGLFDPEMVSDTISNFRDGGPKNDRLDVQKLWLLIAFEMWRDRWDSGYVRQQPADGIEDARAVHYQ